MAVEPEKITLNDLKEKMDQVSVAIITGVKINRLKIYAGGAAFLVAAVGVAYLVGKRRGRRYSGLTGSR